MNKRQPTFVNAEYVIEKDLLRDRPEYIKRLRRLCDTNFRGNVTKLASFVANFVSLLQTNAAKFKTHRKKKTIVMNNTVLLLLIRPGVCVDTAV